VTTGYPELVAAIASEIAASGPIPFARFMELALYHPQLGYYVRPAESGAERIGWSGDFYTSPDVHSILGQALARQARQIDALLGRPDPFTAVEMGPGKGLLARDFLRTILDEDADLSRRLRLVLIERSPAMRLLQQETLDPWLDQPGLVTWLEDLRSLSSESVIGLMFSNELPDAFPVHRIEIVRGQPLEIFVDCQGGRFVECLKPLSQPAIEEYLRRVGITLPDGYRTEINLSALDWMKQMADSLDRGVVITIDYGHTARDLYGPERSKGTLLCYYSQMTSDDPYVRVGLQDMTSHVDFTSLATIGSEAGLAMTGFTNQMSFLMGLGVEETIQRLEPESPQFYAAIHLLKPEGMGRTFKILVQHKGMDRPSLDGLRYKPFFGEALTPVIRSHGDMDGLTSAGLSGAARFTLHASRGPYG
jgi:SAM-dependent MidA family methyltransferase